MILFNTLSRDRWDVLHFDSMAHLPAPEKLEHIRAFATAGTIMSGHSRVTAIRAEPGGQFVDLDVWTASDGTQTATGTATVWLPSEGSPQ